MKFGVTMFPTDLGIPPQDLARALEDRGFGCLFYPEHTHIPTSRRTPHPSGAELPEEYKRTYDPFVALTAAAAVTTTLEVGTGICLVAQRDAIVLAKEVASLDCLSGGRFVFGVGYGWNHDEMESHGVAPKQRRAIVREKMLAIEALWRDDVATFEGEHVTLQPSWSWPKPVQRPRPPVMLGGAAGPTLFRHIVEYGDGWVPLGASGVRESTAELRRMFEEAGRDPESLQVDIFWAVPDAARIENYRDLGVRRCVFGLPPAGPDVILPKLDQLAELIH